MKVDDLAIKNDKRKKLTDDDKKLIKQMHEEGYAIRALARKFQVDHRTVQFILFPERLKRNKELRKERLLLDPQRYYDREDHNKAMQDLRRRKVEENLDIFEKVCPICNKRFMGPTNQKYCCKKCMWTEGNRRKSQAYKESK